MLPRAVCDTQVANESGLRDCSSTRPGPKKSKTQPSPDFIEFSIPVAALRIWNRTSREYATTWPVSMVTDSPCSRSITSTAP